MSAENEPDGQIHTMPSDDYEEHYDTYLCWCQPVFSHRSEKSGIEVWVHKRHVNEIKPTIVEKYFSWVH